MHSTSAFARELNAKMEKYPANVVLGRSEYGFVNLRRPSFDCDWYWGFGYLGNRDCHYHLSGIGEGENINFRDALVKHFGDSFIIKDEALLWQFAEVVQTVYRLKTMAELIHLGGSHYTTNPHADSIKGKGDWEREINEVLIPQQIDAMYAILEKAKKKAA
jgi:hypothetical protein